MSARKTINLCLIWHYLAAGDGANGRGRYAAVLLAASSTAFPAFYVTWAIYRLAGPFAGQWFYFFYLGDYYTATARIYGEMTPKWSLGVEETFYLLWLLLLVRVKRSNLIKALVGVRFFEPIYRFTLVSLGYRR